MKEAEDSVQPTVIITRPQAQAEAFAAALIAANGGDLPIVVAPLMQIDPVTPTAIGNPAHVIFTSMNGVQQAERVQVPKDAVAWCVGDQTTTAASNLGFAVRNAGGTSADLVRMMRAARPTGEIVHLRGAHATGRIVDQLADAGLMVKAALVYAQTASVPPRALSDAVNGAAPLIIPLFSPRSADLLRQALTQPRPMTLIAMSRGVAEVATKSPAAEVITVNFPDKTRMITATLRAYAALSAAKMH